MPAGYDRGYRICGVNLVKQAEEREELYAEHYERGFEFIIDGMSPDKAKEYAKDLRRYSWNEGKEIIVVDDKCRQGKKTLLIRTIQGTLF